MTGLMFCLIGCTNLNDVRVGGVRISDNTHKNIKQNEVFVDEGIRVYNKIKDSVVLIGDDNGPNGSGYYVTKNHIVTCFHVIDGLNPENIILQLRKDSGTNTVHELKIVGVMKNLDIAVLTFKNEEDMGIGKPISFSGKELNIGQTVYLYGHPMMNQYFFSKGIISKFVNKYYIGDMVYKAIYTDAVLGPGSSGGVMVDSRGYIIGMTSAGIMKYGIPVGMNVAVHLDNLRGTVFMIISFPDLFPMPIEEIEEEIIVADEETEEETEEEKVTEEVE